MQRNANPPAPTRHSLEAVDLPLPGGRALRVGIYRAEGGDPAPVLTLALVWPAEAWIGDAALRLPADLIPELRRVLGDLDPAGSR